MHFNFPFTIVQTLWTLTFAALLVLLVVLLGRDRARRFPWFTASIALVALRLLSNRLLYGRMPQFTLSVIFIILADISTVAALLVVVEMARRAFGRVRRNVWIAGTVALVALGGIVLATWGQWPAWKSLAVDTPIAALALLQLLAQKTGLLVDVLTVALGVLVVLFGRRYGAGRRTHTQQILVGLSTASLSQLAVQAIWQIIAKTAAPHSMDEYERVVGLREKLFNANSVVYLAVVIWWIACLWMDEAGTAAAGGNALAGEEAIHEVESPVAEPPEDSLK